MHVTPDNEMIALLDRWAHHFGYFDNRIDLNVDDLSSFTTSGATMIAHAPLWGTKEGEEEPVPVAKARKRLARLLRFSRATRYNLHLAEHPDGSKLCLFFELKARLRLLRVTVQTVPMAFVVLGAETADGLRIDTVHEWAAKDPAAARQVVVDKHGWPTDTALRPYVGFGAVS